MRHSSSFDLEVSEPAAVRERWSTSLAIAEVFTMTNDLVIVYGESEDQGGLFAFDINSGELRWVGDVETDTGGGVAWARDGNTLRMFSAYEQIVTVDLNTGHVRSEEPADSTPPADFHAIVHDRPAFDYDLQSEALIANDPDTHAQAWRINAPEPMTDPVDPIQSGRTIAVITPQGDVAVLDLLG